MHALQNSPWANKSQFMTNYIYNDVETKSFYKVFFLGSDLCISVWIHCKTPLLSSWNSLSKKINKKVVKSRLQAWKWSADITSLIVLQARYIIYVYSRFYDTSLYRVFIV